MKICLWCLLVLTIASCSSTKEKTTDALTGKWLVLYPDHQLNSLREREVYKKYQDSVVNLYGLKLIELKPDGQLTETDSLLTHPAKWVLSGNDIRIREGGKGFNPLHVTFEKLESDTLQLAQLLPLGGEKIKVVWHLKKLDDDSNAVKLFTPEANAWRKKPAAPETETAIRLRLASMLNYYSDYLKLVSKESSYFLIPRIPLPFHYYQHSLGIRDTLYPAFVNAFYNQDDALKAYAILSTTVTKLKDQFEWGENFVVEYAQFFKRMALDMKYVFPDEQQPTPAK